MQNGGVADPAQVPSQPNENFLTGYGHYANQLPRFTANQQAVQNAYLEELLDNPADFEDIEKNEINRFKTETLPYINEQAFGKNAQQSARTSI